MGAIFRILGIIVLLGLGAEPSTAQSTAEPPTAQSTPEPANSNYAPGEILDAGISARRLCNKLLTGQQSRRQLSSQPQRFERIAAQALKKIGMRVGPPVVGDPTK